MAAGSTKGKKKPAAPCGEGVDYVTVRVPIRKVPNMPAVGTQTLRLSRRQAAAQRVVYDGLSEQGASLNGMQTRSIGSTAPLWHATAWILDRVADAIERAGQ